MNGIYYNDDFDADKKKFLKIDLVIHCSKKELRIKSQLILQTKQRLEKGEFKMTMYF